MSEKFELSVKKSILNEITNADLKKEVINCFKAAEVVNKGLWSYAKALHQIKVNEYWRVNFDDMDTFLKKFELSKQTFYRNADAVEVLEKLLVPNGYNEKQFGVSKAYELVVLQESAQAFIDSCKVNGYHIEDMTKDQLRDLIKKFRKSLDNAIDGDGEEKEEKEEKKEPKPKIELIGKNKFLIKYDGHEWTVNAKQLNDLAKAERNAERGVKEKE